MLMKAKKLLVFIALVSIATNALPFSSTTPYLQEVSTRYLYASQKLTAGWTQLPFDDVVQTSLACDQNVWVLTVDTLYHGNVAAMDTLEALDLEALEPFSRIVSNPADCSRVVLATPSGVFSCSATTCEALASSVSVNIGNVTAVAVTLAGRVWVGSERGLFVLADGKLEGVATVEEAVSSLAWSEELQQLSVGTKSKLHQYDGILGWQFEWIAEGSNIDSAITSLTYTTVRIFRHSRSEMSRMRSSEDKAARDHAPDLWIGNEYAVNILTPRHAFHRLSGLRVQPGSLIGGLPGCNVTSAGLAAGDGSVWIASTLGLSRYDSTAKALGGQEWSFYSGPRWLPGTSITSVLHVPAQAGLPARALVTMDVGIAVISLEQWTLEKKAALLQTTVVPRHDRYGLVASTSLKEFGDLSSYQLHDNDNDGLWTSMYLVSQCFRYALTKDPAVKEAAWKHFEAVRFLNNVTCIKGLMARSFVKTGTATEGGLWTESECYPGWTWKADASNDEVVGHMMIFPIFYDLMAETEEEKEIALSLAANIINYIVDNDYYLIDFTGNHTSWGIWNPKWLNDEESFYDERGLNAVQILSWLVAGFRLTQQEKLAEAYSTLWTKHGYGRNIVNQKITFPGDYNFSDDELGFLSLYTFWYTWTQHKDELSGMDIDIEQWEATMERSCAIVFPQRSALWNAICSVAGFEHAEAHEQEHTAWDLREWPTELIDWPFDNSRRDDVTLNPVIDRRGEFRSQTESLLPPDERKAQRWNSSPFEAVGGSGHSETDPGAFLLAYWMNRFHGLLP